MGGNQSKLFKTGNIVPHSPPYTSRDPLHFPWEMDISISMVLCVKPCTGILESHSNIDINIIKTFESLSQMRFTLLRETVPTFFEAENKIQKLII